VFFAASDEDNALRFYFWGCPGLPIVERDLPEFLEPIDQVLQR
jgi:hypothetical protein